MLESLVAVGVLRWILYAVSDRRSVDWEIVVRNAGQLFQGYIATVVLVIGTSNSTEQLVQATRQFKEPNIIEFRSFHS